MTGPPDRRRRGRVLAVRGTPRLQHRRRRPRDGRTAHGWRDRLVKAQNANTAAPSGEPRFTGWCLDKEDLCVAKLTAFREKDRNFVAALLKPTSWTRASSGVQVDPRWTSRGRLRVRPTSTTTLRRTQATARRYPQADPSSREKHRIHFPALARRRDSPDHGYLLQRGSPAGGGLYVATATNVSPSTIDQRPRTREISLATLRRARSASGTG